ncbi:hypothetical protein KAJ27_24805 [bacterium]|nr:hypothetical protein [bacterium]
MISKTAAKRLSSFIRGDVRIILRDPILLLVSITPLLIILVVRYLVPAATVFIRKHLEFDLSAHYSFITGFFSLMTPLMFGMIAGFILLDERDEHILSYISVTPVTKKGYIYYRLSIPVIISFFFSILMFSISGLCEFHFYKTIPLAILLALEAPIMTLFLAAFAGNKVEGLALSKVMNILTLAPFIGYIFKSNWTLIAGISPPYWIVMAYLAIGKSQLVFWGYIFAGLISHLIVITLLMKLFVKKEG